MAGKTGYDPIANTSEMDGPAQITGVYKHFDDLIDFTVDTAANLPQADNWVGRQVRAMDTRKVYVCTALPSTWVGEESYATFTTLIGGLGNGAYTGAGTVTPVPTGTKNAAWVTLSAGPNGNTVVTVEVGVYYVTWDVSTTVAAESSRSGFVDVTGPSGGRVGRASFGPGEDTVTASGLMIVTAAGAMRFSLFKSGGGTPNVSGKITIAKVA